ncbi:complex I NDUFA9 subunit family protein [Caulobacter mirabilis]|uniref:Complex I NDUFA9 subunit family protein n=1 Tax=Caulobacter mirabilis TaxID=69666 RepID=A0A2D2B3F1_9CAUL|nr:complex I NDUFA9 subunit family protein [Caulobacter mirabilis]ATQ44788.1 complex I NDUFA9 subunit family protein [Caulobacter mirabilis]
MRGLVTVFGGTGFVGRQVVRSLARQGWRVRVAARNVGRGYRLRMLGDVGQIEVVQANVRNAASVARALDGAEACVNLVGILYETGRQRFQSIHAMGAKLVAETAARQGITNFVQMSALGADADSPSKYARTKAMGETAVRESLPSAIIIRPSVVFGQEDGLYNKFAALSTFSPALPLVGGGETRFQPVYVGDVAAAVAKALSLPEAAGQTYELGGPATYSFREMMEFVLRETGRSRVLLPLPWFAAKLVGQVGDVQAAVLGVIAPVLTSDQVELLRADNVVSGQAPGLAELGVEAKTVEAIAPAYLYRYRKGGQYAATPEGAF